MESDAEREAGLTEGQAGRASTGEAEAEQDHADEEEEQEENVRLNNVLRLSEHRLDEITMADIMELVGRPYGSAPWIFPHQPQDDGVAFPYLVKSWRRRWFIGTGVYPTK